MPFFPAWSLSSLGELAKAITHTNVCPDTQPLHNDPEARSRSVWGKTALLAACMWYLGPVLIFLKWVFFLKSQTINSILEAFFRNFHENSRMSDPVCAEEKKPTRSLVHPQIFCPFSAKRNVSSEVNAVKLSVPVSVLTSTWNPQEQVERLLSLHVSLGSHMMWTWVVEVTVGPPAATQPSAFPPTVGTV